MGEPINPSLGRKTKCLLGKNYPVIECDSDATQSNGLPSQRMDGEIDIAGTSGTNTEVSLVNEDLSVKQNGENDHQQNSVELSKAKQESLVDEIKNVAEMSEVTPATQETKTDNKESQESALTSEDSSTVKQCDADFPTTFSESLKTVPTTSEVESENSDTIPQVSKGVAQLGDGEVNLDEEEITEEELNEIAMSVSEDFDIDTFQYKAKTTTEDVQADSSSNVLEADSTQANKIASKSASVDKVPTPDKQAPTNEDAEVINRTLPVEHDTENCVETSNDDSPHEEINQQMVPDPSAGNLSPPNEETGSPVSVSGKIDILDYANSEWKGTTYKAQCLRKGYKMLISVTGCTLMRQIRGDNYCALRATAYQVLSDKLTLFESQENWEEHILGIVDRLKAKVTWLNEWTFAERLPSTPDNRLDVMQDCLAQFTQQLKLSQAIADANDRQLHFSALFNSGSSMEIKMFEALKLLLLDSAVTLHEQNSRGDEVPVFAWLLFARDTSTDPYNLMLNHLNPAGNSGGLEQVEMCLLGQALELTIRVVRPSNVDQEDFVTHYPDHMIDTWDQIDLIAEDDRHYNIVVL